MRREELRREFSWKSFTKTTYGKQVDQIRRAISPLPEKDEEIVYWNIHTQEKDIHAQYGIMERKSHAVVLLQDKDHVYHTMEMRNIMRKQQSVEKKEKEGDNIVHLLSSTFGQQLHNSKE